MSSQETSNEKLSTTNLNNVVEPVRLKTIRKSASLKPRKSLLRVSSLRPTRAVMGKTRVQETEQE